MGTLHRSRKWRSWIEQHARQLTIACMLLFVAVLFVGLNIKLASWAQGYDQIDYQQAIWNTTQGRWLAISHYRHTDSLWGLDFIPAILLVVPLYALVPSPLTLNFIQALAMGLGALPTYTIARDRLRSRSAGLMWAAIYLLYPSTWFVTMTAPWQPRTLAVPALLGAFAYLQRAPRHVSTTSPAEGPRPRRIQRWRWGGYMLCLVLALTTRTDAALCVVGMGILAMVWRTRWPWSLLPIALGLTWLFVSTSLIVPAFFHPDYVPQVRSGTACQDYSTQWPGRSPQLAYYCHLGGSIAEIGTTIITRPIDVLRLIGTEPKLRYLLMMVLPLCLLPLLAPEVALPALPILLLNLLTNRPFQYSVRDQYQTLVIPGLIMAAIVGSARLADWWRQTPPRSRQRVVAHGIAPTVFAVCVLCNLAYRNPVMTTLRYQESPDRIAAMRALAARVPPEASLAATSFIAPNMMPRQAIYYFPSAPAFPPLAQADYVLVDMRASALETENGQRAMRELQSSGRWNVLAADADIVLYQRIAAGP